MFSGHGGNAHGHGGAAVSHESKKDATVGLVVTKVRKKPLADYCRNDRIMACHGSCALSVGIKVGFILHN